MSFNIAEIMTNIKEGHSQTDRFKVTISIPGGFMQRIAGMAKGSSDAYNGTVDYIGSVLANTKTEVLTALGEDANNLIGKFNKSPLGDLTQGVLGSPDSILDFATGILTDPITISCISVEMPGVTFQVSEKRAYGASQKVPVNQVYQEMPMVYRLSNDMKEKIFFDLWMNMMFNRRTGNMNFMNEFAATIEVAQLDKDLNVSYKVQLHEAYPIAIAPISYGYELDAQEAQMTVTLAYKNWTPIMIDPTNYLRSKLAPR